jgi:broad specificity phosphatase PhoE
LSKLTEQAFVYLRHGETDWNREQRMQGGVDIPLNAAGELQAAEARALLGGLGLAAVYHSPLLRAKRTAELVNETLGLPMTEVAELREANFGAWEGTQVDRSPGGHYDLWIKGGITPEGGESFAGFLDRSLAAINLCLEDAAARNAFPLIVAHGGVYWAVRHALGLPYEGPLRNGHPILHRPEGGQWFVGML